VSHVWRTLINPHEIPSSSRWNSPTCINKQVTWRSFKNLTIPHTHYLLHRRIYCLKDVPTSCNIATLFITSQTRIIFSAQTSSAEL